MHSIAQMHRLDRHAIALYLFLWTRSRSAVVRTTRHRLATALGVSTSTCSRALKALKRAGWIKRRDTRVKEPDGTYTQKIKIVLLQDIRQNVQPVSPKLAPTEEQAPILPNWTKETV